MPPEAVMEQVRRAIEEARGHADRVFAAHEKEIDSIRQWRHEVNKLLQVVVGLKEHYQGLALSDSAQDEKLAEMATQLAVAVNDIESLCARLDRFESKDDSRTRNLIALAALGVSLITLGVTIARALIGSH